MRTIRRRRAAALFALLPPLLAWGAGPRFEDLGVVFPAGGDSIAYRLPSLIVTSDGTLIAACQQRLGGYGDWARSKLAVRRSHDGGKTWEPIQIVHGNPDTSVFNGNLVEDRQAGSILATYIELPFHAADPHRLGDEWFLKTWIPRGGGFTLVRSADHGATWSKPVQIVAKPNPEGWAGGASYNNTHGVQLEFDKRHKGRLVVAGRVFREGSYMGRAKAGILYSDDHGDTWQVGGAPFPSAGAIPGEITVGETAGGEVYVNIRNTNRGDDRFVKNRRLFARSRDGGQTFYVEGHHDELPDPGCNASQVGYSNVRDGGRNIMLFLNPADVSARNKMTVRASYDEARTWSAGRVIDELHGGYSDIAVLPDKTIVCLYERDKSNLVAVRFNLAWVEGK